MFDIIELGLKPANDYTAQVLAAIGAVVYHQWLEPDSYVPTFNLNQEISKKIGQFFISKLRGEKVELPATILQGLAMIKNQAFLLNPNNHLSTKLNAYSEISVDSLKQQEELEEAPHQEQNKIISLFENQDEQFWEKIIYIFQDAYNSLPNKIAISYSGEMMTDLTLVISALNYASQPIQSNNNTLSIQFLLRPGFTVADKDEGLVERENALKIINFLLTHQIITREEALEFAKKFREVDNKTVINDLATRLLVNFFENFTNQMAALNKNCSNYASIIFDRTDEAVLACVIAVEKQQKNPNNESIDESLMKQAETVAESARFFQTFHQKLDTMQQIINSVTQLTSDLKNHSFKTTSIEQYRVTAIGLIQKQNSEIEKLQDTYTMERTILSFYQQLKDNNIEPEFIQLFLEDSNFNGDISKQIIDLTTRFTTLGRNFQEERTRIAPAKFLLEQFANIKNSMNEISQELQNLIYNSQKKMQRVAEMNSIQARIILMRYYDLSMPDLKDFQTKVMNQINIIDTYMQRSPKVGHFFQITPKRKPDDSIPFAPKKMKTTTTSPKK